MSWEYNNLDRRSSIVAMIVLGLLAVYAARGDREGMNLATMQQAANLMVTQEGALDLGVEEPPEDAEMEWFLPERATYPKRVIFYCPVGETPKETYPEETRGQYVMVQWRRGQEGKETCPLTITLDGKTFGAADFEFENFLKRGATEPESEEKAMAKGALLNVPVARYHSRDSKVLIHCLYDLQKKLTWLTVMPSEELPPKSKRALPARPYDVSMGKRTVTLPANYKTLAEKLGAPEKREERRLVTW